MPTKEHNILVRNNLLAESDRIIADITDPVEIERWKLYRQQLRDFFVDKPGDFDYTKLVWPRTPKDIDALKEKAAQGDTVAQEIIERDGL